MAMSPALLALLQGALILSAIKVLWGILRRFVIKSPLANIRGPKPSSIWTGNLSQLFARTSWDYQDQIADEYGSVIKLKGMLGEDTLYLYDPKALHHIILNDQHNFSKTRFGLAFTRLIFGNGVLSVLGAAHRKQRKMLNPVFSIAHMRNMTPLFYNTAHRLKQAIQVQVAASKDGKEVDILNWMGRTALELIGQGGLGYSFDPLVATSTNSFGDSIKSLLPTASKCLSWRLIAHHYEKFGPAAFRRFLINFIPNKHVRKLRDISDTIAARSKEIVDGKVAALRAGDEALKQQVGEGKDIMSILLKANMASAEEDRLSDEEVLAQVSTLVFAATDTTSNALSRTFDLLTQHPDAQDKLRAELLEASGGGDIPYDQLVDLPYLDAVCRETLRLHSPVPHSNRRCIKDTVLPLSEPIVGVDGTLIHEILVPKGTNTMIAIRSCNRNKAIWGEDASEWKPERWLSPLPSAVKEARVPGVYANLMTFLGGGHSCIGFKFSQLEMKVVLAVIIKNFKLSSSGADIVWNVAGVSYPTVGTTSNKPSLPIMIQALDASSQH